MIVKRSKKSALKLTIRGSVGDFYIPKKNKKSIPVKYILSSIGLSSEGDTDYKIMEKLKPFREAFDIKELDFEQVMQRELDDVRVSRDLIPYILDSSSSGLVKLFPPIVVVLVPRKEGKPMDKFPGILKKMTDAREDKDGIQWQIIRSGEISKEFFEFKQMVVDGEVNRHDYAQLKINTSNTELVIVDGQHRAMALIALFRNLNKWDSKAQKYEKFYRHWTKDIIKAFDLDQIRLPAIYCVFPDINDDNNIDYTIPEACRSIFLALNKNARKVSEARNVLLDDYDLIAVMLRTMLSEIKNLSHKSHPLRLWAVELDSAEDKQKLLSRVAITGVMPLYNLLENLLLYDKGLNGLRGKGSNLKNIKLVSKLISRLSATEELTSESLQNIQRKNFEKQDCETLQDRFKKRIYPLLEKGYASFEPFKIHLEKFEELKAKEEPNPPVHAILFEGQSLASVFDSHKEYLSTQVKDNDKCPQEIKSALTHFNETDDYIKQKIESYNLERNKALFGQWIENTQFNQYANSIYRDIFFSSAFQTALFMAYFTILDKYNIELNDQNLLSRFEEYISSINQCFRKNKDKPYRLFKMFSGSVQDKDSRPNLFPDKKDLKKLLIPGEMNPREWIALRYIFLEIWNSDDEKIQESVEKEVIQCRKDLIKKIVDREVKQYINENKMELSELSREKENEIVENSSKMLSDAIINMGSKHSQKGKNDIIKFYREKIKEENGDTENDEEFD